MENTAKNYYGVIIYMHPEIDHTERVPFATQAEMHESITHALDSGFKTENINCYVKDEKAANAIFSIMDKRKIDRCRIFQITDENLQRILGDFTIAIQASA